MELSADYVIVGAGSAGCALARRLADTGASVVLLEAGGSDRSRLVRKPGMVAVMHSVPQAKKRVAWDHYSTPQTDAMNRAIPQPHGKLLGGSSSINGMLFVRGNRQNYDDWAAEGNTGWSYDDVLPSYRRMENWEDGANDFRGAGGPVQVTRSKDLTVASQRFVEAFAQTAGIKQVDDYNGAEQEGAGAFQQSTYRGLRYSSSVAYLDDHNLPNLHVETGVTVSKVVLENGRATAVQVLTKQGPRRIRATREIVLSAGVYG
ncbi:MAG: FAD-dependent oxidoreductase, partial [Actinomycetota bacterium]|nr:FAD-dependent oxidoreductase [Actinomycetota bacterium]